MSTIQPQLGSLEDVGSSPMELGMYLEENEIPHHPC